MDSLIWRKLPEELVTLVFAHLPLPQIIGLRECSKAWSTLSETSTFQRAFTELHPNFFAVVGLSGIIEEDVTRVITFDMKSNDWSEFPLSDVHPGETSEEAMCSSDGGLLCIVPCPPINARELLPILVGNPLTGNWKELPKTGFGPGRKPALVQIVTNVHTHQYKVMLLCTLQGPATAAQFARSWRAEIYDSESKLWTNMDSGLVYGARTPVFCSYSGPPVAYDCTKKMLFTLSVNDKICSSSCITGDTSNCLASTVVKDRLITLHETTETGHGSHVSKVYKVSECAWRDALHTLLLGYRKSALPPFREQYNTHVLATDGDLLVVWDNSKKLENLHHQVRRLYDRFADTWRDLPPICGPGNRELTYKELRGCFVMKLRWGAKP